MLTRQLEKKVGYLSAAGTNVSTTVPTTAIIFGNLTQGATDLTRVGQKITVRSLDLRCLVSGNVAGPQRIRIMMIRDKQTNASLPSGVDWFIDKTTAGSWFSGYDTTTVGPRYEILYDKLANCNVSGGASNFSSTQMLHYKSPPKFSKDIIYNISNAGTIGDIIKGSILFCAYSDAATGSPGFYTFELQAQFTDG